MYAALWYTYNDFYFSPQNWRVWFNHLAHTDPRSRSYLLIIFSLNSSWMHIGKTSTTGCSKHTSSCMYTWIQGINNIYSLTDVPFKPVLFHGISQLGIPQCLSYNYGCSRIIDNVNPAATDAPVSVTQVSPAAMDAPVSVTQVSPAAMDAPVSVTQVSPAAMEAPVSLTLSTLQLWMLQCHWHCQPCSYGCTSVSDTASPAAMDAPVSVTLSALQLWMLQCQWHYQPCSYGCPSVSDTVSPAAMDAPVSVTQSTLQLWML